MDYFWATASLWGCCFAGLFIDSVSGFKEFMGGELRHLAELLGVDC
jgi:hypothetical protein